MLEWYETVDENETIEDIIEEMQILVSSREKFRVKVTDKRVSFYTTRQDIINGVGDDPEFNDVIKQALARLDSEGVNGLVRCYRPATNKRKEIPVWIDKV